MKLFVDILIYKEILKNKNKSIKDLQNYVDKIKNSESDNLDHIIVKSFDFTVKYNAE